IAKFDNVQHILSGSKKRVPVRVNSKLKKAVLGILAECGINQEKLAAGLKPNGYLSKKVEFVHEVATKYGDLNVEKRHYSVDEWMPIGRKNAFIGFFK